MKRNVKEISRAENGPWFAKPSIYQEYYKGLVFFSLILCVAVLALEIGTRLFLGDVFYPRPPIYQYDELLLYKLRPAMTELYVAPDFQIQISTNDRGYRIYPGSPNSAKGTTILVMGDSFTMGWGVDDNETWPFFLEQYIGTHTRDSSKVINTGVNGYGTWQYRRIAESALRMSGSNIEAIVIMLVANDPSDNVRFSEVETENESEIKKMVGATVLGADDMQSFSPVRHWITNHSYAYGMLSRKGFLRSVRIALERQIRGEDISLARQDPCILQDCSIPIDQVVDDIAYIISIAEDYSVPIFITTPNHGFIDDELVELCPKYQQIRNDQHCVFVDITSEITDVRYWEQ